MSEGQVAPKEKSESHRTKAPRQKCRRWPWILGGVLLLIVLLVALLPTLLSTGPLRGMVLRAVNKNLNGSVQVKSWSLGWFSGFTFKEVQVADTQGQAILEIQKVRLPASIPALLDSKKKNLGDIVIESPRAHLVFYADGTTNLAQVFAAEGKEPEAKPAAEPQPLGFDVSGKIVVTDASITAQVPEAPAFEVKNLNVDVHIESLNQPIIYKLAALLGQARSPLSIEGSARVFKEGLVAPEALEAKVDVSLKDFDLAEVKPLAKQLGAPVDFGGTLDIEVSARVEGSQSVQAMGKINLTSLALAGGPLGDDKPQFDRVDVAFDIDLKEEHIEVGKLTFDSPVAHASVSGVLAKPVPGEMPAGTLKAQVKVDLPALTQRFPHTLKLQEGLSIESGTLELDLTVASRAGLTRLDTDVRLAGLAATREGKRIEPEAPITLSLKATQSEQGPEVESLKLTSSFVTVQASGNMDQFELDLTSDLSVATREVAKFVDLGEKSMRGKASVALRLAAVEGEAQAREIGADVQLDNLQILGITKQPISEKSVGLKVQAIAILDEKQAPKEIKNIKMELKSSLATASVTVGRIAGRPPLEKMTITTAKLTAAADLERLLAFARGVADVPADLEMKGTAKVMCAASLADGAVNVPEFEVCLSNFELAQADKTLHEPQVRLTAVATIRPHDRRASVPHLTLALSPGKLEVTKLEIADWAKLPAGTSSHVSGNFDIAKALARAKDFVSLPEGVAIGGALGLEVDVATAADAQKVTLTTTIASLKLTAPEVPPFEEKRLEMSLTASVLPKEGNVNVDAFSVTSALVNLQTKGAFTDWRVRKHLNLDGTLECNFDRIAPMLVAFTGQQIELNGKKAMPFQVETSLAGKDWHQILAQTTASAKVYIKSAKAMGIETGEMTPVLRVEKKSAKVTLETTVNQGKLSLAPVLDLSGDVPVLSLPKDSRVLDQVQMTRELANELVARALPFFKDSLGTQGNVSFVCESLSIPLDETLKEKATMTGRLGFRRVSFRSTGLLDGLLALVNLSGRVVQVPDQEVGIELQEGRIYQDKIQLDIGDYSLLISGSVGLDTTLDMLIEMPITEEIIHDKKTYELLKDATIKVPISGTASAPKFDRDIVRRNLRALMAEAAKKLLKREAGELIERGLRDIFRR